MVKNIVTISLIIFVVAVVIILGAGVFLNQNKTSTTPIVQQNSNTTDTVATITSSDVAKHNTVSDCWLIVNEKVYNVTDYIYLHPADPNTIIDNCGKDATVAFDAKGGKGSHSQRAKDALNDYYVGDLGR